jgi:translation initiation factor RLI1
VSKSKIYATLKNVSPLKQFLLNLVRCPFEAIAIINLPTNLESQVTHRYTANAFKLHRLPTPRPGQVLGLVGTNGIGKSTALKILAGKLKPNLGRYEVCTYQIENLSVVI